MNHIKTKAIIDNIGISTITNNSGDTSIINITTITNHTPISISAEGFSNNMSNYITNYINTTTNNPTLSMTLSDSIYSTSDRNFEPDIQSTHFKLNFQLASSGNCYQAATFYSTPFQLNNFDCMLILLQEIDNYSIPPKKNNPQTSQDCNLNINISIHNYQKEIIQNINILAFNKHSPKFQLKARNRNCSPKVITKQRNIESKVRNTHKINKHHHKSKHRTYCFLESRSKMTRTKFSLLVEEAGLAPSSLADSPGSASSHRNSRYTRFSHRYWSLILITEAHSISINFIGSTTRSLQRRCRIFHLMLLFWIDGRMRSRLSSWNGGGTSPWILKPTKYCSTNSPRGRTQRVHHPKAHWLIMMQRLASQLTNHHPLMCIKSDGLIPNPTYTRYQKPI
ncbi:uncharacterized protein LOC113273611 [Papaver somniferum]|uniref:uncharacterized protein LOC113273611 n=1 Tax=Papaver somniferum TaxID=3469 RepID=UPI000E7056EE|nr:uncharacterized protein LOC113273611 [Papaver somniferum]